MKFTYSTHFTKEKLLTCNSRKSTSEKLKAPPIFLVSALTQVPAGVVCLAFSAERLALLEAFCNLDHIVFHTYLHGNCEILVASDRKH